MTSIPLFPLNTVLFPDGYLPLQVFEVRYLDMVKKCIASGQPFAIGPEQQYVADALGELIASLRERKTGADQIPMIEPFRSPLLRLELVADALAERGMLE